MSKGKIKDKYLVGSEVQRLSAQDYNALTPAEIQELKEVLAEQGQDINEYEKRMRALWPKSFIPGELKWQGR